MEPLRGRHAVGLTFLLTCLGASSSLAQDPAPAPAAVETSPEALLKSHELKRSGSTWLLASESTVLKDLRDARALYRQVEEAIGHRHQLELGMQDRQGTLMQMRSQSEELGLQISQVDQQLENLVAPPGGNNLVAAQREELARNRNELVRHNNQLINQINNLQEMARQQSQDQDPRLQLNAELAERREKYMQALLDFRASVDKVKAQYDELAKNTDVTKALDALSVTYKTHQRLGPSKALSDAIKVLEKSEGTVKSESINLLREGGVFHVMATLGKTPTKMVFDTGAGLTTISSELATRIGVKNAPGDSRVKLKTADGTVVDGKIGLIPTVRVGKFTVSNVECAVMPADKGEIDPLLGQSFLKNFKVEFNADAGKLTLKRVETPAAEAEAAAADAAADKPAAKATTKSRRPTRPSRPAAKTKRGARPRDTAPAEQPADESANESNRTTRH